MRQKLFSKNHHKLTTNEANAFTKALYFARRHGLIFGSQICKYNLDFIPKFGECDIRAGFYKPKGKKPIDTFDLAQKGIKLLYGKTRNPFLHESPAYDKKRSSKLYKIEKRTYFPIKRNSHSQKSLIKKILNNTTSIDKSTFAHLLKMIITKLRHRLENEFPKQEVLEKFHNHHSLT